MFRPGMNNLFPANDEKAIIADRLTVVSKTISREYDHQRVMASNGGEIPDAVARDRWTQFKRAANHQGKCRATITQASGCYGLILLFAMVDFQPRIHPAAAIVGLCGTAWWHPWFLICDVTIEKTGGQNG